MSVTNEQPAEITAFVDKKRYLWLLSTIWPASPMIALFLVAQTGWGIWYGLVLVFCKTRVDKNCAFDLVSG